ncbi:hypothetical protein [Streptomyces sp. ME19-01-6]|nr:hypothetical protein [Streptomyces sp. ME19-01-6]MDX3233781.1 hypothetical protein [Streptomyces sp. ME19-01-6]
MTKDPDRPPVEGDLVAPLDEGEAETPARPRWSHSTTGCPSAP